MDDDKINEVKNQSQNEEKEPQPIFETQAVEESSPELKPEEIAPEFETPQEIPAGAPPSPPSQPSFEIPPAPPESHGAGRRTKFLIIGIGVTVFLLIFFLIIRLVLGGRGQTEKKQTNLTYWGLWEDNRVIDPMIQAYQAQNENIKITYIKQDPQDYRLKLLARSRDGQGPDIFRFHNTWIPEIKDVVAPLPSSIMSGDEFSKTFYPIHTTNLKVGEQYFGIPLTVDGLVLFYNDDIFKRAGYSNPPKTWDELGEYSKKVTVKDANERIITGGIALGTAENVEHFSDIFGLFLVLNGGRLDRLDQPEAVGALDAYRAFAEPPENVWDGQMPNSIVAFIQEKVGMIIAPSWQAMIIRAANPQLNFKVLTIPPLPGNKSISLASYWVEGVSKYSPNQIEAWRFLKFLSEKENMTKLYELQSKERLFGEPYSRSDLAPLLKDNQYLGAVIEQADSYVSLPVVSRTYDGDEGLNDGIIAYIKNAINNSEQGVSYEQALQTAKQGVDQVLSNYKVQFK